MKGYLIPSSVLILLFASAFGVTGFLISANSQLSTKRLSSMQSWERKPDIHPQYDDWTTAVFYAGVGLIVAAGIKTFFIDVQHALPRARLIQTAIYLTAGFAMVFYGNDSHRRFTERWKEFEALNQLIQDIKAFEHRQQDVWNWRVRESWSELRHKMTSHEEAFTSADLKKEVSALILSFGQSAISEYLLHEEEWHEWATHYVIPSTVSEARGNPALSTTKSISSLPEKTAIFLDQEWGNAFSSLDIQNKTDMLTYLLRDKTARRPRDINYVLSIQRTRGVSEGRPTSRGYLVALTDATSSKILFYRHLRRSPPKTLQVGPAMEFPTEEGEAPITLYTTNDNSFRLLEDDLENTIRELCK